MIKNRYARIIIDISHEKVDRPFCYIVPEELRERIQVGNMVIIPFGQGNSRRKGYVIELMELPDFDPEKIKEILDIEEGVRVESKLILLAAWMKEQYGCTMIQALQTVLPVKVKVKAKENRYLVRKVSKERIEEEITQAEKKKHYGKLRVLQELWEHKEIPYQLLTKKLHVSSSTIQSLNKGGILEIITDSQFRNPSALEAAIEKNKKDKEYKEPPLSLSQKNIISTIIRDMENGYSKNYLIHGITGSGKTRVYMELIESVVQKGKTAIMLIPEIALTFQTVMRFQKRFGNRVSVINSSLSMGEKYDQCERAKKGEIDVIIGPRSALFTPFENIGLIVIDEEHESSYKSESMPKYQAREVAEKLASLHQASLVIGSATPLVDSYYLAQEGKYRLFELKERLTGGELPKVYIEDLREELKKGNRSIFSERLQCLIRERLEKKEQVMLFLNRRGYSGFLSCRSCGEVIKCPHCDVSLTLHKDGSMVCHYCGFRRNTVKLCPSCGSKYVSGFKAGTQKIEEEFKRCFGEIPVLRMDKDTTSTKDSYEKILTDFMEEKAQVLIGTQMIVKGHDFPKVTLVGILAADISLGANDYRCSERTFQLLTQAAGRAGRGKLPGEVVIQTYQPEHYSIRLAAKQDYISFYEEELLYRKLGHYPPVSEMLMVQFFGKEKEKLDKFTNNIKECIETEVQKEKILFIGPADASIGRINDIHRRVIILKHGRKEPLVKIKDKIEEIFGDCDKSEVVVQFDFNPMSSF